MASSRIMAPLNRGVRLGIVGSEGAKFTPFTEGQARFAIRDLLKKYQPTAVVSGACHLGGVDIWAIEEAMKARDLVGHTAIGTEYPTKVQQWDPPGEIGYKARNLLIANDSDIVVCITLKGLPRGYDGMRFQTCYHHPHTYNGKPFGYPAHVKSGGCWTMEQARKMGKHTELIVIGE